MASRMENWEAGDFCRHFREAAIHTDDEGFRHRFGALAEAIEPLDREFLEETARCGRNLGGVLDEMRDLASRMGYCSRDRGFDHTCEELYAEADQTIEHIQALRDSCFL